MEGGREGGREGVGQDVVELLDGRWEGGREGGSGPRCRGAAGWKVGGRRVSLHLRCGREVWNKNDSFMLRNRALHVITEAERVQMFIEVRSLSKSGPGSNPSWKFFWTYVPRSIFAGMQNEWPSPSYWAADG